MLDRLIGSKTRVRLLQLFLANPKQPFFVRELTRKISAQNELLEQARQQRPDLRLPLTTAMTVLGNVLSLLPEAE